MYRELPTLLLQACTALFINLYKLYVNMLINQLLIIEVIPKRTKGRSHSRIHYFIHTSYLSYL